MHGARSLLRGAWPLLLLALLVRVAQIAATHGWAPVADPADYVRHALSIAHGHGMAPSALPGGGPSALRPPAFPYFLGAVFAVSGDSFTAGRLACALLGVVSVALIGVIAEVLWNRRAALAAIAIAIVYPPLVLLSGTLLSESLALPLVLGLVALLLVYRDAPPRWVAPLAGLLFGLALLDRPALAVFAIPLVGGLWDARRWRRPLVALAVAALTLVPWTIRNAVEFHAFVPISTQSGFLVAGTYNPVTAHDPVEPGAYRPATFDPALRSIVDDRSLDENQVSRKLGRAGRDYARGHPSYVARVFGLNSLRLLGLKRPAFEAKYAYAFQGIADGYAKAARFSWYVVAVLALAGIALGAARRMPWWLWTLPLALLLSVAWVSGDLRYRAPIEPFAVWAAAWAITSTRRALRRSPTLSLRR
jgi:4-amino-4-deoxy-L-arabinose transferase-like glycosyltransferase